MKINYVVNHPHGEKSYSTLKEAKREVSFIQSKLWCKSMFNRKVKIEKRMSETLHEERLKTGSNYADWW